MDYNVIWNEVILSRIFTSKSLLANSKIMLTGREETYYLSSLSIPPGVLYTP